MLFILDWPLLFSSTTKEVKWKPILDSVNLKGIVCAGTWRLVIRQWPRAGSRHNRRFTLHLHFIQSSSKLHGGHKTASQTCLCGRQRHAASQIDLLSFRESAKKLTTIFHYLLLVFGHTQEKMSKPWLFSHRTALHCIVGHIRHTVIIVSAGNGGGTGGKRGRDIIQAHALFSSVLHTNTRHMTRDGYREPVPLWNRFPYNRCQRYRIKTHFSWNPLELYKSKRYPTLIVIVFVCVSVRARRKKRSLPTRSPRSHLPFRKNW